MNINEKIEKSKEYRKNGTKTERMIWKYILKNNPYHWKKQRILKGYIVDFYCDKLKLVIEADGETHDTNERVIYDKKRTEIIESLGIKILRLRNEEIQTRIYDMKEYVEYLLEERRKELNIPPTTLASGPPS